MVRSPDGQAASYTLGEYSIQRAAASILKKYYVDFPIYNPYLDTVPATNRSKKAFKLYDVDGMPNGAINVSATTFIVCLRLPEYVSFPS